MLRAKENYHTDLIVVLQLWDAKLPIKNLCTHITYFQPMLMYETLSWTNMISLGKYGERLSADKKRSLVLKMFRTAVNQDKKNPRNNRHNQITIHRCITLADGSNPIFVNFTHQVSPAMPSVLRRIDKSKYHQPFTATASVPIRSMQEYITAETRGLLSVSVDGAGAGVDCGGGSGGGGGSCGSGGVSDGGSG